MLNNNTLTGKQKLSNYLITTKYLTKEQENELLKEYKKTGNIYYRLLYTQRILIDQYLGNRKLTRSETLTEVSIIKKYLEGIDTWGHYELSIFSNCLFIFDDEYIYHSFQRSVTKMKAYVDTAHYSELLSNFLLNGIHLSFHRSSVFLRKLFLGEWKKVSDRYKHTLDLARYKAFTALALLADGNERALEEIDEAIHFFEWLGLEEVKEEIIELRDSLLKKTIHKNDKAIYQ